MSNLSEDIRKKFSWRRVETPKPWLPKEVGEEIIGFYGGRTLRRFGRSESDQYEVALVHIPNEGCVTISGVRVIQLLDAALIEKGHPIRIVWQGTRLTAKNHEMKMFEVFVADGDPIPAEHLPGIG